MTLISRLPAHGSFRTVGSGQRPSAFAVSELATASLAAVGCELSQFMAALNLCPKPMPVEVDHRLASLWFGYSFRPSGWDMPNLWDPIAGDYECQDGWIRLHTNLPHHRKAALGVLGCGATHDEVALAVKSWPGETLETEIVKQGGVAAQMRTRQEWKEHAQGHAIRQEPLVHWGSPRKIKTRPLSAATVHRPLQGLRVLDLTRVLAGPVSTRTLAGLGADILRIDPPGWDEPGVIQDISLGKTMATLDLRKKNDRQRFETLLAQADVLVHGYRPGALDALGYGEETRNQLAPNRVEVTLNAYGWTGPWAKRRGFDSLVQMSSGIAAAGQVWAKAPIPTPLPVQALDHATGYLMAAAVLSALRVAQQTGTSHTAQLSLARTAELLCGLGPKDASSPITSACPEDYAEVVEGTSWGEGYRLKSPLSVGQTNLSWSRGASGCGSHAPAWTVPHI